LREKGSRRTRGTLAKIPVLEDGNRPSRGRKRVVLGGKKGGWFRPGTSNNKKGALRGHEGAEKKSESGTEETRHPC